MSSCKGPALSPTGVSLTYGGGNSGISAWVFFWEEGCELPKLGTVLVVTSPKCPNMEQCWQSPAGEGPFPAPRRGVGMWEAQWHHPSCPSTPGLLAMDLLEVVKLKSRVFSIIVLAKVAFLCHFQGILVLHSRNPPTRFRDCCSKSPQFLDTSPSCVCGVEDTPKREVRGFGGHSSHPAGRRNDFQGQRGFR